jgi:predicted ATPase
MTAAPRGEIWLDEEVAARSKDHYELDYIGEMNFKGFIQPQKVYTLIERKDEASLIYQGEMVGREVELQRLSVFVQPIFHGQFPGMLVVWGEPGMGKSRLVYEFLHRLRGSAPQDFKVFLAQTDEILRAFLNPFRYWLKVYFGVSATQVEARNKRSFNRKLDDLIAATRDPRLADELDRTRSFLGELVGLSWPDSLYEQLDAQGRYENTFIGLATLLQAESLQNPVVINLEDAHWLDEDSKAFLSYLFRVLAADERKSYPIAILATARFEGSGLPLENVSYQQVDLGQINRAGLAAMVESHLGGPAGEKLLNFLEERSEGNPFFAEQILHYLKEEKLLVYEANIWNVIPQQFAPLPLTIRALLVARLDRLEQEVKEVVQTAAVLGREFEVQLLGDMLKDRPMLTDDLCQAEGAAIWSPLSEIRYLFKHALLRDAAYRMQLRAKRQALHALAVEALEKVYEDKLSQQYGELAYHAERAGLGDKARHYLQLAGREAQQAYQNSLAIDYYSRAFALTPENNFTARFDLLSYREDIYNLLGEREKRLQDLEALQILSLKMNDPEKGVIVALRQADYAYDFGDFSQAIQFGELAVIQALTLNELGMAVSAYDLLSNALLHQNNLESAERYVELGLELASQIQDQADDSRLFNIQGMIAVEERNLNRAWSCFEQSLALAREKGNLLAQALPLNSLGMVAGFQGDFSAALAFYEQSLAICQQIGARSGEARVLGNLGWVLGNMGEYTKARAYAEQTLRIAREVGDRYNEAYGLINLSSYATALGDYETGLHSAEHSLTLARQIGEVFAEAWSLTYLGHCHFALKQYPGAGEAYQAALEIRRERNQALLATEPLAGLARVALENGDLLTAQMHVDPILDFLDSAGTLDGADEPLRIYLTCYLVLQKGGDKRAKNILITAHNLLQSRAESIKDEAARQAFLENIEHNQEILAAWENDQ